MEQNKQVAAPKLSSCKIRNSICNCQKIETASKLVITEIVKLQSNEFAVLFILAISLF